MGWFTGVVVYLCIWWTVIFCTLPLWVQRDDSEQPETVGPGAPKDAKIKQKFILTTIIAALIWLVTYTLIMFEIVSFREIANLMIAEDFK